MAKSLSDLCVETLLWSVVLTPKTSRSTTSAGMRSSPTSNGSAKGADARPRPSTAGSAR